MRQNENYSTPCGSVVDIITGIFHYLCAIFMDFTKRNYEYAYVFTYYIQLVVLTIYKSLSAI